jgi:hypothetical protein
MSERRDDSEVLEMIRGLDSLAPEINEEDPAVAGGIKMAADLLRWSLRQPPRYGPKSIPMLLMGAKAHA